MIQLGQPLRARVLSVKGNQAVLGIYVEGNWHRIQARLQGVSLKDKDWIRGSFQQGPDGTLFFAGTHKETDEGA